MPLETGAAAGDTYDYVIVGAGSTGCVLANRLSADPSVRVCLIEAGPEAKSPWIGIPLGVTRLFHHKTLNWRYSTVPQANAAGRRIYVPRGRVVGGSSSINGMVYTRGDPSDYDDWEALGNPGWGYADVLPYFRRSEHNEDFPDSPYHGRGGPLNVTFLDSYNPMTEILFEAAQELQFPLTDDFCGPTSEGFGRRQVTTRRGRRVSAADAYLAPARRRPNLDVLSGALARRIVLDDRRATGVELDLPGGRRLLTARREVILSAGVFGTPQLLKLSGLGPADELRSHGIDPVLDLAAVGAHLRDHISAFVQHRSASTMPYGLSWRTLPWVIGQVLKYPFTGKGLLANNILHSGGFVRSDNGLDRPDVQFILIPTYRDDKGRMGMGHGYALMTILLRPKSEGRVTLASADPRDAPLIDPQFFDRPEDLDTLVRGVRLGRRLLATRPFDAVRGPETHPGADVESDAALRDYIRRTSSTAYHPVGTCRMGPDPADSVVGPDLRVHGCTGLRIADASIMPTLPGGNTNGPCIMIGEKAADLIRGLAPPPRSEVSSQRVA